MSALSIMQDGRRIARTLLVDQGTIKRPGGGSGTLDPVTGDWTPAAATTIYTGDCRVRAASTMVREQLIVFGDISTTVTRHIVSLPHDAPLVNIGDVFSLTATNDPEILNVAMRVVAVVSKSILMYRQLGLELIEQ